jgi:hypothetical protein
MVVGLHFNFHFIRIVSLFVVVLFARKTRLVHACGSLTLICIMSLESTADSPSLTLQTLERLKFPILGVLFPIAMFVQFASTADAMLFIMSSSKNAFLTLSLVIRLAFPINLFVLQLKITTHEMLTRSFNSKFRLILFCLAGSRHKKRTHFIESKSVIQNCYDQNQRQRLEKRVNVPKAD